MYRLDALACPPDGPGLTTAAVQEFPATQLFMEREVASGAHFIVRDLEAPIVADICRKLDGVALAIDRRCSGFARADLAPRTRGRC